MPAKVGKRKVAAAVAIAVLGAVVGVAWYFWFRYPNYELIDLGSLGGCYGAALAVHFRKMGSYVGGTQPYILAR